MLACRKAPGVAQLDWAPCRFGAGRGGMSACRKAPGMAQLDLTAGYMHGRVVCRYAG